MLQVQSGLSFSHPSRIALSGFRHGWAVKFRPVQSSTHNGGSTPRKSTLEISPDFVGSILKYFEIF